MGGGPLVAELSRLAPVRATAGDLAPALVSPLDDVPDDALGSKAKRYAGYEGDRSKDDEEYEGEDRVRVCPRPRPVFRRVLPYDRSGVLKVTPLGGVVYVDLFLAHVLLNHLGVLHHILADPHLLLGNWPLLHHHLFLGD